MATMSLSDKASASYFQCQPDCCYLSAASYFHFKPAGFGLKHLRQIKIFFILSQLIKPINLYFSFFPLKTLSGLLDLV